MKRDVMKIIACPKCGSKLDLTVFLEEDQVIDGLLTCECGAWYPIIRGVPRLLVGPLRGDYGWFMEHYRSRIGRGIGEEAAGQDTCVKKRTSESFGLEWKRYKSFGWNQKINAGRMDIHRISSTDDEGLWQHTKETFWRKTLLSPQEVPGKFVLDVGVGNGRYAQVCREAGAHVFGIDMSEAVDIAYQNTKGEINIIQCDIFDLPFREGTFDVIYSTGVLHHTPSTKRAFLKIVKCIKERGVVSIHVYHKGNFLYEITDKSLRMITTKLPLRLLWSLCYLPTAVGRLAFASGYTYAALNALVAVRSRHHFNFDWYSAPVASHHTEDEVVQWYEEAGFEDIRGDSPTQEASSYYAKLYPHFTKKDDGRVKQWAARLVPPWAVTVRGKKHENLSK
jgi:2-polyprenyl-3-methyl-5-hydroxy-6-metoxy-1,4-benzoquinol methylase/uncharacterized protein YbaR (Trm112 family)